MSVTAVPLPFVRVTVAPPMLASGGTPRVWLVSASKYTNPDRLAGTSSPASMVVSVWPAARMTGPVIPVAGFGLLSIARLVPWLAAVKASPAGATNFTS